MAPKKKGKLESTQVATIPSLNSTNTPKASRYTNANASYFQEQRRTLIESRTLNVGANGPYRGVVLRRDEYSERGHIPVGTWLEVYYNHLLRNTSAESMPEKLVSYKVYIPELHSMLPPVKIYPGRSIVCDEHAKIDLYPNFIAKSSDEVVREDIRPGSIVWVDFVDKLNHEDGLFIGPVFGTDDTRPAHSECRTAMQILLEACGVPPNSPTGGAWIGAEGLKKRATDLFMKQKRVYEMLYYLGGGKPGSAEGGTPYGHGGDPTVYPRIELADLPERWKKYPEIRAYFESITPWPLRGPCLRDVRDIKTIEQTEDVWMFPVWVDNPNNITEFTSNKDTMISYINDISYMMDALSDTTVATTYALTPSGLALKAQGKATALGLKAREKLTGQKAPSFKESLIARLSGRGTVDKTGFLPEDILESPALANKKRLEMSQRAGLMYGWRFNLDPNDVDTALPETPKIRAAMIQYYEYEKDRINLTFGIIEKLVKAKKAEDAVEDAKLKDEQAGSGADLNCPDGDTFTPEYMTDDGPSGHPRLTMSKIKFDNLKGGRKRAQWRALKNMRSHPKETVLIRGDVHLKMSTIINIINDLGGVIEALGPDIGAEDHKGRYKAAIGRGLANMPKPGEKGKSPSSYHHIYKALDINGLSTTLSLGGPEWKRSNGSYDIGRLKEKAEYVQEYNRKRNRFTVWAKTNLPDGFASPTHPQFKVQKTTLNACVCGPKHKGPADVVKITGNYINLTEIFKFFGFVGSGSVGQWRNHCDKFTNKDGKVKRHRAEWWHFQLPEPIGTLWGDALKKIYSEEYLEDKATYRIYKNRVATRGGWFRNPKGKKK